MCVISLPNYGIPSDINYYLDSSVECYMLPTDVYWWSKLFCKDIVKIIDNFDNKANIDYTKTLFQQCSFLEKIYLEWQQNCSWEEYVLCLALGIRDAKSITYTMNHMFSNSLVSLPSKFLFVKDSNIDKNGYIFSNGMKEFEMILPTFQSNIRMINQWNSLDVKPDFTKFIFNKDVENSPETLTCVTEDEEEIIIPKTNKNTSLNKNTKKALIKSSSLLNSIEKDSVQLFLSGKIIEITGNNYIFKLTKSSYSNLNTSHGSCDTNVYLKKTGEWIASLCVYTPNVTVFDHIASIILHCKAGLEDNIINESNIIECLKPKLLPEEKRIQYLNIINNYKKLEVKYSSSLLDKKCSLAFNKLKKRAMKKYPYIFTFNRDIFLQLEGLRF